MTPIALQLYTLRDAAKDDLPGVLRTVGEIGYKGVEFAGLHGHDPLEIRRLLDDLGMVTCSSHVALPTEENAAQIAETESILGNKRVVSGFGPQAFATVDACKEAVEKFNKAVEVMRPYGIHFGIHNHEYEFVRYGYEYAYDMLMRECPGIFGELDVYWTAYGKADPVEIVSRYVARLPLLHIKDGMLVEGERVHTAVGKGKLDMPAIVKAADPSILEWLIVELDNCDTDMLQAVKDSYEYLTSNGLAVGSK